MRKVFEILISSPLDGIIGLMIDLNRPICHIDR